MKRHILYYNRLVKRYNKYKRKLSRAEHSLYHYKRRDVLAKRVNELFDKIQNMGRAFRLAAAGGAMASSMILMSTGANAQELTLESPNQAGLSHAENFGSPTFTDLDGDGDLDLVVGERYGTTDGGLFTFINDNGTFTHGGADPLGGISLQIDSVHNIVDFDNGGGYFGPDFADYDGDGDDDLFIGQTNGDGSMGVTFDRIRFFENDGGTYTEKFGAENPLSAFGDGDFTKPTFVDLDADGDLDVAIGKGNGELVYWENDGQGNYAAAAENPFAGFFSGEGSEERSEIAFSDVDGDGDLDGLVGHKDGSITYLENTGTASAPVFVEVSGAENPFGSLTFNDPDQVSPAFADIDLDGDEDLYVGIFNGPVLFAENDGGTFTLQPDNNIGLPDIGDNAAPDLVDWDEDGDMDAVVSNGNILRYFENENGLYTEVSAQDSPMAPVNAFLGANELVSIAPSFVDWNGDGYQDLFIGNGNEDPSPLYYFENDQFGVLANAVSPFGDYSDTRTAVDFMDWDGDGDLDAFVGNKDGNILYFENNGDGTLTQNDTDNPFAGDSFGENAQPEFYDWDGDGDLDAFIGKGDGSVEYWVNTGTDFEKSDADNDFNDLKFVAAPVPAFGDVDGDGVQDAIVGDRAGKLWHFSNAGTAQPPTAGTAIGDQFLVENVAFDLTVADDAFTDPNGDIEVFRAKQADGSALPAWLSFNRATKTFSGTPSSANIGSVDVIVEAVDADNNVANTSFTIYVTTVTGIEELAGFSVYPNPTSRFLKIADEGRSMKSLQIMSLSGSVVRQLSSSNDLTEINIENLKAGVYVLRISNAEKTIALKFIKD